MPGHYWRSLPRVIAHKMRGPPAPRGSRCHRANAAADPGKAPATPRPTPAAPRIRPGTACGRPAGEPPDSGHSHRRGLAETWNSRATASLGWRLLGDILGRGVGFARRRSASLAAESLRAGASGRQPEQLLTAGKDSKPSGATAGQKNPTWLAVACQENTADEGPGGAS